MIEHSTGIARVKLLLLEREGVRGIKIWVPIEGGFQQKVIPIPGEPMPVLNDDAQPNN